MEQTNIEQINQQLNTDRSIELIRTTIKQIKSENQQKSEKKKVTTERVESIEKET